MESKCYINDDGDDDDDNEKYQYNKFLIYFSFRFG